MKVAFVNYPTRVIVPPPQVGSVDICLHEIARRLVPTCEVVVYSPQGNLAAEEYCDGVQYRRVSSPGIVQMIRRLSGTRGAWRLAKKYEDFRSALYHIDYAWAVAKDLRTQHCDLVHIVNLSQYAPIIRALNPRTKVVLNMHCEWLTRLDRSMIARRLTKVDRIIGCSEFVTGEIRRVFPKLSNRCATVYDGVDVGRFVPDRDRRMRNGHSKRILFVGRTSPEKGLHVLLQAFSEVVKRFPDAKLEIAGPAEQLPFDVLMTCGDSEILLPLKRFYDGRGYRWHLEQQVRDLNLTANVIFAGVVPGPELAQHYRQADVFVFPSLWNELFGMPIAEAMSTGVPVVCTRVAGVPEVVEPGETGLTVEPCNVAELAEAILRLLSDGDLRESMGKVGRQRVLKLFSWNKIAQDMLHQYEAIYGESGT
jgi:glycosyltransferase involved in cell wall biosynthesis